MRRPPLGAAALLLLVLGASLSLRPAPADPVAWRAPPNPGYSGPYAANTRLAALSRISLDGASGPEHVGLGPDGNLYAAVDGGSVLRMRPDGSGQEVWAQTGGRVLGFAFDERGRMIAADAFRGLLAIAAEAPHHVTVLADHMPDGEPIRFPDAVTIGRDGSIYFTDASRRYAPADYGSPFEASLLDYLDHRPTGRVLVYRPDRKIEVVADGLSFANGIVLSEDGRSLFVAESGAYRVWRIDADARGLDLAHGPAAQARVVLDDLPGFPDNLTRGLDGRIWLGLAKPRTAAADAMAAHPFLRKLALRLPRFLWPVPPAYGHVLAFTEDGQVVADLQDPQGAYPDTTGVLETADRLYIQSVHADSLGWLPSARAGLPPKR
ncbi:strictosidine synthase [Massilia sp. WF1]|uniref:SMP-30/gluconolactonase/LRE family protein n=1 Tax=unclassified Massilia TaxID=2609279 RepID=UPI00064A72F2|nr:MULTISPECIES: SMP-30/gluconolactonase/LRE family protein [unclassified Massilia]ALK97430.1 strictosidine synthase [Massilia sp. WG5]KLU36611.1 strictosidine synthase [Massilia sp. WF1]